MKNASWLLLLAPSLFLASFARAQEQYDWNCGPNDAHEFTIEELAILAHAHQKIEQVLPLLPERMLARYVLMEESGSLQGATPDNPRVLLYGNTACKYDANLLVSFNGDPKQRGYAYLEAIQFHPDDGTYETASFFFQGDAAAAFANRMPERNPGICQGCHGAQAILRPNWESYSWDGAVGSKQFPFVNFVMPQVQEKLDRFSERGALHSRYQYLKRQENAAHAHPLPAFRLAALIAKQQIVRLRALLKKSPDYSLFKYALLGAVLDCPNFAEFAPPNAKQALDRSGGLSEYLKDMRARYARVAKRVGEEAFNDSSARIPANLRWLLESRGVSMKFWSNTRVDIETYLFDPTNGDWASLATAIAFNDPDFNSLRLDVLSVNEHVGSQHYYWGGQSELGEIVVKEACQSLGATSRGKLSTWNP